jgi:hypothetical protein
MSEDEIKEARLEKLDQIEDDRIFMGAAIMLASSARKDTWAQAGKLQKLIKNAINVAIQLNDEVEIRRGKIREARS